MIDSGIIAINKPKGWTSFDVVNKIKHIVYPKKVGHLGTLDPIATGVLLITVGKATKIFDLMQEKKKTYIASFEFGYETDTLDSTGEVVSRSEKKPTLDEIKSAINSFIGRQKQIPPKYSAKSIGGVRAYDLARRNIDFEIKPKEIEIFSIEILAYSNSKLKLNIECSSGTYIRSIGRDLAYMLNTKACMTDLVRFRVGDITLEDCYKSELKDISLSDIEKLILPINKILKYKTVTFSDNIIGKLLNGQIVKVDNLDGNYCLIKDSICLAIIKIENFMAKMTIFLSE